MAIELRNKQLKEWTKAIIDASCETFSVRVLCHMVVDYLLCFDVEFCTVIPPKDHLNYQYTLNARTQAFCSVRHPSGGGNRLEQTITVDFDHIFWINQWVLFRGTHALQQICNQWTMTVNHDRATGCRILFGVAHLNAMNEFVKKSNQTLFIDADDYKILSPIIRYGGISIFSEDDEVQFAGQLYSPINRSKEQFQISNCHRWFSVSGSSLTIQIHHENETDGDHKSNTNQMQTVHGAAAHVSFTIENPFECKQREKKSHLTRIFAMTREELKDFYPFIITQESCNITISSSH
jgi:hypothetical protein